MTVINQIMVEMVNVVARSIDDTHTATSTTPLPITATTSTIDVASSTAASSNSSNNSTTQSPLLFFVALGFGVVFTNLWYALLEIAFYLPFNTCVGLSSASSIASDTTLVIER